MFTDKELRIIKEALEIYSMYTFNQEDIEAIKSILKKIDKLKK